MALLVAKDIRKAFRGEPVLSGVSLSLANGRRYGMIGSNGSGKSTLAGILAGALPTDEGTVDVARNARVVYLPQRSDLTPGRTVRQEAQDAFADLAVMEERLRRMEAAMGRSDQSPEELDALVRRHDELQTIFAGRGGWERERLVEQALSGLGLPEELRDRDVATLSGGQATRVGLARALLRRPDLLILDEPTNHLDLDATEWLEDHLLSRPGAVLVISHDRWFLDRVAQDTFELDGGRLFSYPGGYSKAEQLRRERRLTQQRKFERQQAEIRRSRDFIRRNIASKFTVRRARSRQKMLDRMERLHSPEAEGHRMAIPGEPAPEVHATDVLLLEDASVDLGARRILDSISLRISRGQCVGVVGPNGAGKTTLLRLIVGELEPVAGKVRRGAKVRAGYLAQEPEQLRPGRTVLDTLLERMPGATAGEGRSWAARFLFRGEEADKDVAVLSGGEAARLALALLFLTKPNFLVLDEPTNHLDIPAREALEEAIGTFTGTVLLVSHDRYLLEAVADRIVEVRPGRLLHTDGGWTDHLATRAREREREKREREEGRREEVTRAKDRAEGSEPAGRSGGVRNPWRFARLEEEIMAKEERVARIQAEMLEETVYRDPDRFRALERELRETQAALERLNREWEEWLG